jgi:O-antigen ligase
MATYLFSHKEAILWNKRSTLVSALLTGNLAAFFLISYIPGILGVDSRVATAPFRVVIFLLALYTMVRFLSMNSWHFHVTVTLVCAAFFWTAYSLRYIADAGFLNVPLGDHPENIGLYLFGITLPAFWIMFHIRDVRLFYKALSWSMILLGLCCLFSLKIVYDPKSFQTHTANDVLSHIAYGHMGLTAVILAMFVLLRVGNRYSRSQRLIAIPTIGLGAYAVLISASRGAFVAALILIPGVLLLGYKRGSKRAVLMSIFVVAGMAIYLYSFLSTKGFDVTRLFDMTSYTSSDKSVYVRQNMAHDAWQEYLDNPVLGSSIVERQWLTYPHNAFIEAYMATGTFGGTAFAFMMLTALWRAILLVKRYPRMSWISLCFFQQFIGAMFSGGIYGDSILFCLTGIILGVDLAEKSGVDYKLWDFRYAIGAFRKTEPEGAGIP